MPNSRIGLRGVAAELAPDRYTLAELSAQGLLTSPPDVLADFGFRHAHIAEGDAAIPRLARTAATAALDDAGLEARDIDLLVWASARPEGHALPRPHIEDARRPSVFDGFRYPSAWLQDELDLDNADVVGVAQQGCSTMFSALRTARAILAAEPDRAHALCVGVDAFPAGAPRELLYNVVSDAACAVVVSRTADREKWIGYRQISRGYYWDPASRQQEAIAAYFPLAKLVVEELLAKHDLRPDQIDVVVPTGVSAPSWQILLRLLGIPEDRLYSGVESFGHTISADSFIYLQHLRKSGRLADGARILLFTYGFGSSWCALLLEH